MIISFASQQPAFRGGGGHTYGPELWPQPVFAASTGLTLSFCTVTGGKLVPDGSGNGSIGYKTAPFVFVAGETYHYSVTKQDAFNQDTILSVGPNDIPLVDGLNEGDTVMLTSGSNILALRDNDNNGVVSFSACSVKKQLT